MDAAGPIFLLIVPAAAAVAATGLLIFALRGRRVDDHPVCRKCGFDLVGKPADATRCSECGADLSRRRAVRVGWRETRRGVAWLAGPPVVLSLRRLRGPGGGRG